MRNAEPGPAQVRRSHQTMAGWYGRVLGGSSLRSRKVEAGPAGRVHVVEAGSGSPMVLVHGSGVAAGFFNPLLEALDGLHAMALDLPGRGLSSPVAQPRARYRETAVAWLDQALDALGLESTSLLGHSAGGLWALWYALARPGRVNRLVLIGPPALPGTRCPLPYRVLATPGLGELVTRFAPPDQRSTLVFARFMGEEQALATHPDLIDLFMTAGRDPVGREFTIAEIRHLISPLALVERSGFRRSTRITEVELGRVSVPTLLVWGEDEPLGGVSVARAVADLIPGARLAVLPGGHAPWLGQPERTAAVVVDFAGG